MKNHIGRTILLVKDYENSTAFYERIFGFERLFDVTTDVGQRFLHIGNKETNAGLWLLMAEGEEQEARVGNQTAGQPTLVIYTEDLEELYKRLLDNDVKMKVGPVDGPEYRFLHCFDHDGNELVVVELKVDH